MARITCTDHCSGCGRHFHSVAAFDRHRIGPFQPKPGQEGRRCVSPRDEEAMDARGHALFVALSEHAARRADREPQDPVTVWTLGEDLRRARVASW